jgi:hypothetical protein
MPTGAHNALAVGTRSKSGAAGYRMSMRKGGFPVQQILTAGLIADSLRPGGRVRILLLALA